MARRALTAQERAARQEQQRELVQQSVEQLRTSDGWQRWLRTRKAFRRYSPRNTLLIAAQCPTATHVAGFKKWLSLGYCVRKGQTAIYIWAPMPPSNKKLAEWEAAGRPKDRKPRTHFALTSVFDFSQVAELPAPAEPAELQPPIEPVTGEHLAAALPSLIALAQSIGSAVSFDQTRPGVGGFYRPADRQIVIDQQLPANGRAATLIHELAHALVRADGAEDDPSLDYATEEWVAETVAYMVADTLGLDTAGSSVPYLACWSEGRDVDALQATATLIDSLARRIEDAVIVEQHSDETEQTA